MAPSSRPARIRSRITVGNAVAEDGGRSSATPTAFFAGHAGSQSSPLYLAPRLLEVHSVLEENSFALDICAPANEKIAQFQCIIIAAVERIKPKENLAARGEVLPQIA